MNIPPRPTLVLMIAGAFVMASCDVRETPSAEPGDVVSSEPAGSVERVEAASSPADIGATIRANAIQVQPGPDGVNFALEKVETVGDIMTVQLRPVGPYRDCCKSHNAKLSDINIIDDNTSQQIGVLQDADGDWQAQPKNAARKVLLSMSLDAPDVIWIRFPAMPENSTTMTLSIPGIAPFSAIPVKR